MTKKLFLPESTEPISTNLVINESLWYYILNGCKNIEEKIKNSQFRAKNIFAVLKMFKFSQNIDYFGEYQTDFSNFLH